jgi:hypothetical protein
VLRSIELWGVQGEELEMSSKYFTQISDTPRQKVIVRQPAVVRKRPDGVLGDVISKGIVE